MSRRLPITLALLVACFAAAAAAATGSVGGRSAGNALEAGWVELGPGRTALVRAITEAGVCPDVRVDGVDKAMNERAAPTPPDYAVLTCQKSLNPQAERIKLAGRRLRPPQRRPQRIAVVGDTGCRLAAPTHFQACNDPAQWPFEQVAESVAGWRPQLIVHVGDYLYREDPCPAGIAGCAGSPYGYNWPTWDADFFTPAAPALGAAPWLFLRGNHELCSRGGVGWFRFLDPRPMPSSCQDITDPYAVGVGRMRLLVLDSSNASDFAPFNPAPYVSQFAALDEMVGSRRAWLLTHRPLWGLAATMMGASFAVTNETLELASSNSLPGRVRLVLSGHLHAAEVLGFAGGRAPQLVAGNGGTQLDAQITAPIVGTIAAGAMIVDAEYESQFGFFTFARRPGGWAVRVRDVDGNVISRCPLVDKSAACEPA